MNTSTHIESSFYGKTPDGERIDLYTLTNAAGLTAKVTTWGAGLVSMIVPDRYGVMSDITLGFDSCDGYLEAHPHFGVTTGRFANRIARGWFILDRMPYVLGLNDGVNHLHGGKGGFHCRNWEGAVAGSGVRFRYTSPDGEEGYPGELKVTVSYALGANNELRIDYEATTNRPTVLNLTNHAYWNLAGAGEGDILGQELRLHASQYLPVDATAIPTGQIAPVAGSALDFTVAKALGKDLVQMTGEPGGYDHNFIIDRAEEDVLALAAEVYEPKGGRVMTISTTEPGIQLYTGNYLDGAVKGKAGRFYHKHSGFCLETQHYPDSPNRPSFPSTVLRPGQTFRSATVHQFSVR